MELSKILDAIESKYPLINQSDWDFNGLQVKTKNTNIKKIVLSLDVTYGLIERCINDKVDLVISHHPFLFGEPNQLFSEDKKLKTYYDKALKSGLNIMIVHTPIDNHIKGIASSLILSAFPTVKQETIRWNDIGYSIAKGSFDKDEVFINLLKLTPKNQIKHNIEKASNFKSIIMGSGASGFLINAKHKFNSNDLLIIGEVKHHEWTLAKELGLNVISIGHHTEIEFAKLIETVIRAIDPNGELSISINQPFFASSVV